VRVSPEAENALFALYAVKLGLISEGHVEKALGNLEEGQTLSAALQASGKVSPEDAARALAEANPEVFPGYRIEAEAGRGGMGVVYRARQLSMDRPVALKVLTRRLSQDADYVEKFLVEARSAAKLNHEHIVAAIDAGSASDLHYFAMEFVDGCTVADLLDKDKLPWVRAFEIGEQVARALGHAHHAGLVHRDVKPENILVTSAGEAKLCDLGLAKPSQVAGTGEKADMTEGTPYYCSPEQALGRTDIDPKSDVYSLGITIYTMITGEPPFDGDSPRAILLKQVKEPFPDLEAALPEVPGPYRDLIKDMVVKDRAQRLESAEAFAERLTQARRAVTKSGRTLAAPSSGPPIGGLIVGAGLFVAIAVVIGLSLPGDGDSSPTPSAEPSLALETPRETPRGPVRVRSPRPTQGPGLGHEGLAQAKAAYEAAESYAQKHPQDPGGAAERYAAVAHAHPGTGYATRAEAEAERLEKEAGRSAQRALDSLSNQVLGLLNERRFRDAQALVDTFRESWKERGDESVRTRLGRVDGQVKRQADSRATELEAVLAKDPGNAAAIRELQELATVVPAKSVKRLEGSLVKAKQRLASVRWTETYEEVLRGFERGGAAAAQGVLEGAQREAVLEPFAAEIRSTLSDVAAAEQAGRGLDRALRGLVSRGELSLRLASGEVLEGRFASWDPGTGGQFLLKGGEVKRTLSASDLAPEEFMPWVLPPAQGRANALLLLSRGLPEAAALAYERYRAAGGAEAKLLAARVAARQGAAVEGRVQAALQVLTAPDIDPTVISARLGAFPTTWRRTAAFKAGFPTLRESFVAARGAQLARSPMGLFNGQCKVDRRGKATLSYDFGEPGQGRDFRPSPTHFAGSEVKVAGGSASFKGVVFVEARFLPGSLKVVYKVRTWDPKAPNLNLLLQPQAAPWTGILCGVGLSLPGIDSLKIDTQARKRAGYVVDLPAHALVQLAGQAPERRMPGVLAADIKPSLRGKTVRVTVTTSDKGVVKVKIGSRIPLNTPVAGLAQSAPGYVALAPLSSTYEVVDLQLIGKLDPEWLQERARAIADQEAAALPGPL
jgi:serine/threonine protein kinase